MNRGAPRVGVLVPFWEFWEPRARGDLRARMRRIGETVAAVLPSIEVVCNEVLFSPDDAAAVSTRMRQSSPDVLLVVQVMAVPPARTMVVLDSLPELPLVVWAMHEQDDAQDYDHSDITMEGATVGTSQLVNLLVRSLRVPELVVGRLADPEVLGEAEDAIRAGWAARRIAIGTLARVGEPPSGYDCVICNLDELTAALGLRVLEISPAELATRFMGVDEGAVKRVAYEAAADFDLAADLSPDDEGLRRSFRFAAALERFGDESEIDAGAVNCHVPELRFSPQVGIAPCFALGRETSRGIPWTCAGDVLTAVAMLTTKLIGAAALYHELERIDYETDEVVIANTGEHDLAWADPRGRRLLRANAWFSSDPVCGACACFSPPEGPATLVAFTQHPVEPSGFRYVVAEGRFTGRTFPATGTPNGGFRFRDHSSVDGYRAWALAGANHHSSSTPGHVAAQVRRVAAQLGVGVTQVS